ncbi:AAA family ATPase [Amycolatopsis rubida]|uniref:AAA family ATPase n=1 Tax=Amycolatopsis rubida TaxID=112413 RepID=A0ABX0CCC8_9PSEU|nr:MULTISPECIES: AAA family ATPase [Amycolatopsis]MYW97605.1 AAA family ATPase [Amycolatopsis rubida]NEC62590.1 AAA family ATPase [Amycolatopsis rubida]OAP27393.1 Chloramphenicol 3-O phosphotransferase [Amycolatopsis sp. M39]
MSGHVILLNGASSSGKSSIAAELLDVLPGPYFSLPRDAVNSMRSRTQTPEFGTPEFDEVFERTVRGYHRMLAGLAAAGNGVIADHVLRPHWLDDCLEVLREQEVTFVGVHCPVPELRRREQARGDRPAGLAERQYPIAHAHGDYDLECDTSVHSPKECAQLIAEFIDKTGRSRAFARLSQ